MSCALPSPHVSGVRPTWAVAGGRITVEGQGFDLNPLPEVRVGGRPCRVVFASPRALDVVIPDGVEEGSASVQVGTMEPGAVFVEVGAPIAEGLHQVDSPVFDLAGNLYVTYSGTRGEQAPIGIFRIKSDGSREPFASKVPNPTSMAFAPSGDLYVSSRFEGKVYKVTPKGEVDVVVSKLGSTSGIVFDDAGTLFVGDRTGQIFRVEASGQTSVLASLPSSIAAFHLAVGPSGTLYVTAPTLSTSDSLYRIDASGKVDVVHAGFGRPQGLAFDADGKLHVVEALAGAAGLYALTDRGSMQLTLAAEALVGVAFGAAGEVVVASNDTAYRLSPGEGR